MTVNEFVITCEIQSNSGILCANKTGNKKKIEDNLVRILDKISLAAAKSPTRHMPHCPQTYCWTRIEEQKWTIFFSWIEQCSQEVFFFPIFKSTRHVLRSIFYSKKACKALQHWSERYQGSQKQLWRKKKRQYNPAWCTFQNQKWSKKGSGQNTLRKPNKCAGQTQVRNFKRQTQ